MINIDNKSASPEVATAWKNHIYDILGCCQTVHKEKQIDYIDSAAKHFNTEMGFSWFLFLYKSRRFLFKLKKIPSPY